MIKMFQKYSQDEAQALVKALKEGNQLAFSIVYKTYAAQSFSLAFKYLLNKELAEDAVQNLFLKLWLRKEEIDETKPINRYLFTMLKNDLLNTLRDSKKNICLLEDCLSMVLELEDNSLNENLKQEQMNIIQQALDQLSPQRRKVFEMKVSGKYSNQKIADKLNLSINTIKFQYSQSLKQIRMAVGELGLLLLYWMV
jgi:RNA polymerase sigma-70 factor (family 1)